MAAVDPGRRNNAPVSVVVPTLNYGRYLKRALDSVLAQSHAPHECIVVDNGSTDGTDDVLAAFGRSITVLRQPAKGPSATRNMGIRAATGRYIAFLDADDHWLPDKLRRQVALLEGDPGLGAVGCSVQFVSADGVPIGGRDFPVSASRPGDLTAQLREVAVRQFWIGGSASGAVMRREVLDSVGSWDETLPSAEDWDLWMRVAARHVIRNIPERLVQITLHGAGTWRDPATRERNQWRALEAALARWPQALGPVAQRMRALVLADVAGEYAAIGETKLALSKYLASLRCWPRDSTRWRAAASLFLKRLTGARGTSQN